MTTTPAPSPAERPTSTPLFRRPISSNEWIYLACEDLAEPLAVQIVVEGTGAIDAEHLRQAVAQAAAVCPGSRLERHGRIWMDSGRAPEVRVVHDLQTTKSRDQRAWSNSGCAPQTGDAHDALPPSFRTPLSAVRGNTCEVVLLPGPKTTVIFRAHHAVMDGRGALTWVRDVFRALRGETVLGADSTLDDDTLLDELSGAQPRRRERQQARWPAPWTANGQKPAGGWRRRPKTDTRWHRRTLHGAPSALVARTAAAMADFADAPVRVMVPVDLRRHRPGLLSTANLTLPVFLQGDPGRPWDAWHEQLLLELADEHHLAAGEERQLARLPLGTLRATAQLVDQATMRSGRYLASAVLSHLGRVEPEAVRAPGFTPETVYSVPLRVPYIPVSLTTVIFGDRTELLLSHTGSDENEQGAQALAAAVAQALVPSTAGPLPVHSPAPALEEADAQEYDAGGGLTLVELWRRQVEQTPDLVALIAPGERVTYRELDERSDVVAAELRARGIGRGTVVGLLADRSVAALAGLWGVLKAGAAYLPLEPRHPRARITALLTDAKAALCLVGAAHAAIPEGVCPVLALDNLPAQGAVATPPAVRPEDIAYVIYTSGSTGTPKGVQVPHKSLVAYRQWAIRLYQVDAATRFALFTSLAFDLTGTAIFLPLLAGGSIAVLPGEPDLATLTDLITSSGVNALKLTPAHLDLITGLDILPTGFRTLVVGGEQLHGSTATRAQRMFGPQCRIVNEYGPTEAAIGCIVHTFDVERDSETDAVPIGHPVTGTRALLLDANRKPVATGEIGELYLAGAQLASGYLGRPDLDQERFIRLDDNSRAYRTGDLARHNTYGQLEFLQRADNQLSIRGHRIEPSEIEAALERHPRVNRAIVLARPGRADGQQVLCAYVTGDAEPHELTAHAATLLPSYLVPAVVTVMDSFPLTTNGKTDLQALPEPFPVTSPPPRPAGQLDDIQAAVARIWSRILGIDELACDPSSDFHALGGDSLTFMKMINEVARDLIDPQGTADFHIQLRNLLREPTLARVSAAVRTLPCASRQPRRR